MNKKTYVTLYRKSPEEKKSLVSGKLLHEIYTKAMANIRSSEQNIPKMIKILNNANIKWKTFARKCKISNLDGFNDIIKTRVPKVYEAWKEYNAITHMNIYNLIPIEQLNKNIKNLEDLIATVTKEQDPKKFKELHMELDKLKTKKKHVLKMHQLIQITSKSRR